MMGVMVGSFRGEATSYQDKTRLFRLFGLFGLFARERSAQTVWLLQGGRVV
jgi:hypothetical protein